METDSNGAFALRVRGDSMEPEFHEGDIIIVNTALKQEHNDYMVVSNEEGEAKAFPSPISQINRFWISAFAGMTKKGTLTLPCTEGEEICNIYSIIGI